MGMLMEGHILKSEYQNRLSNLHKRQLARSKKQMAPKQTEEDMDVVETPSSSEDEKRGDEKERMLTFACLDNMDEKNKQDLKQNMKNATEGLIGLQGVKHMARCMVRAERNKVFTSQNPTGLGGRMLRRSGAT